METSAAPEDERQDQVQHDHGDDRETDGAAHRHADACWSAARVVAVVAVDERDDDGEGARLDQAEHDVLEGQVEPEVVVVLAARHPEELGGDELGGEEAGEERDEVQRDDGDEGGDDAGAHEVDDRGHGHDLEGVDLLGDPHGPELSGEAGTDLCGEGDAGYQRGDLARVGEGADEPGEALGADLLQPLEALQPDLGAREERHREDDEHHPAAHDESAGADGDVAHQVEDDVAVLQLEDDLGHRLVEHPDVEAQLLADVLEGVAEDLAGAPDGPGEAGDGDHQNFCGTSAK
jgi:hypothetical protein